ncbi:hypothetical protein F5887DRAFT_1072266 [Amanita rubescens]|nr:hypothetical protein F5887DRAFT_1072266 [Amanita rubescens]
MAEAAKPFDSTALADTVLRSSDGIHFYVLGALLRYVSPTFRDLFSLGRGSAASGNEIMVGHPVIPLTEDSKTIHCLLRLIYPSIDEPDLADGRLLIKVWRMAEKYDMDVVVGKVQKHLLKDGWMKKQPHRTSVIATIFGWKDGLEKAKQLLVKSRDQLPVYCDELEDLTGIEYYSLLEYLSYYGNCERPGRQQPSRNRGGNDDTAVNASASKPFDSQAKADIIFRSSDAIDFYVYRPFLEMISPAFEKIFSYTKASEFEKGLSVVRVSDHSEALRFFLLVLHQRIDKPPLENPGLIADICMVARKYEVPRVEARMKEQLTASSSLVKKPLCVYAIAKALGWDDVAKMAAKNTLGIPLENVMTCTPELERITGGDLYRLLKYRTKCEEVACKVVKDSVLHGVYGYVLLSALDLGLFSEPAASYNFEKELKSCPRGSTYTKTYDRLLDNLKSRQPNRSFNVHEIADIIQCRKHVAQAIEKEIDKVVFASALSISAIKKIDFDLQVTIE